MHFLASVSVLWSGTAVLFKIKVKLLIKRPENTMAQLRSLILFIYHSSSSFPCGHPDAQFHFLSLLTPLFALEYCSDRNFRVEIFLSKKVIASKPQSSDEGKFMEGE